MSASVSLSISASPSIGFTQYSRGNYAVLPTNTNDLETLYTEGEEITVENQDGQLVGQEGALEYMVHLFKVFVGENTYAQIECVAQSDLAPNLSAVYLQIFNNLSSLWETLDSNNTAHANQDFSFFETIEDLTNYKDDQNVVVCRVYQLAI